jgi:hypothetical protein
MELSLKALKTFFNLPVTKNFKANYLVADLQDYYSYSIQLRISFAVFLSDLIEKLFCYQFAQQGKLHSEEWYFEVQTNRLINT